MPYIVPDSVDEPLYVITPIFNPVRFKSRWKHYERFAQMVKNAGGILYTIEAGFGERSHAIDDPGEVPDPAYTRATEDVNYHYVQVRTDDELWIKENLINIAISRLPATWKYVAWIDADIQFALPNWVGETIHQLQHYKFVQMFQDALDLGPRCEILPRQHKGFVYCYEEGFPRKEAFDPYPYYGTAAGSGGPILWHPGFAWAATRDAIDAVGGLIDYAILGAGDNHMAHALIGKVERSHHADITPQYRERLEEWQYRAETHIRRNVGYVKGTILHYWHGKKADRRYNDRWRILVDNAYRPDIDLKKDWQGLHQLVDRREDRFITLRDQIRAYFRARNEDSIDV